MEMYLDGIIPTPPRSYTRAPPCYEIKSSRKFIAGCVLSILRVTRTAQLRPIPYRSLCFDELDDQALLEKVARLLRHHRHLRCLSRYYKEIAHVQAGGWGARMTMNSIFVRGCLLVTFIVYFVGVLVWCGLIWLGPGPR